MRGGFHWPQTAPGWWGLATPTFLYGTAFTIMFTVLPRLGRVGNSAIMNIEPIIALLPTRTILGQSIARVQVGGGLQVAAEVIWLGLRRLCRVAANKLNRSNTMATHRALTATLDIKKIASDSGVAVEAYDTYDSDEETMAAAHRFAAGLLNRLAVICDAQPGAKTLDAVTLRSMAAAMTPG